MRIFPSERYLDQTTFLLRPIEYAISFSNSGYQASFPVRAESANVRTDSILE